MDRQLKNRFRLRQLHIFRHFPRGKNCCIIPGWNSEEIKAIPHNSENGEEFSSNWVLGLNHSFPVRMTSCYGLQNGMSFVKARIYFKSGSGTYPLIADFILPNEDNILDVAEQLKNLFNSFAYRSKYPEAASAWETEMQTLEKNVVEIANLEFDASEFIDDTESNHDNLHQQSPEWIDWIINIFRHSKIDESTPIPLLKAYTRLARSWQCWASVNGMMAGDLCGEAIMRNDTIARIIDGKINEINTFKEVLPYVCLLYYLLPGFIDDYSGSKNDINFVKVNSMWGVSNVVSNKYDVDFDEAQLYFDVREDNERMPRWITTYMKGHISAITEQDAIDNDNPEVKSELSALQKLALRIRLLKSAKSKSKTAYNILGMQLRSLLDSPEILADSESSYLVGRLLTEYFSRNMTDEDRSKFYESLQQRAVNSIIDGNYKNLDLFNYAAAYLEYLFTQNDMAECRSITTYFRDDYSCLLYEEEYDDEW